jgi:lipoprotein-anchoring transpeptidase ErfK/SrfK
MKRLTAVVVVAAFAAGCSGPGSFFSLDEPGLAVRQTRVLALSPAVAEEAPPKSVTPPPEAPARRMPALETHRRQKAPPEEDERADTGLLVATSKQTLVYARPSLGAAKLGYLRAGAVVHRSATAAGYEGCRGGFYEIAPEGYVCAGPGASLDPNGDLSRAVPRQADRTATLPYEYGASVGAGAPLYSRIPTADDERAAEPALGSRRGAAPSFDELAFDDVPWFLKNGGESISTAGVRFPRARAVLGNAIAKSAFAFASLFESGGRRFGLTTDMAVVPLDRLTHVVPSRFHGLPLGAGAELPVVFVRSQAAALYAGDPLKGLRFERRLEYREAIPITGRRVRGGGISYLETSDGQFIVDQGLVRIDAPSSMPPWAKGDRTWIDVSIDRQVLVAYEGTRPVFVTLVSTGIDGKGDPETTHSTIQGQFLIHTKHVTVTMDGDEVGDEFDLRDVPYVQYFKEGFALHAAYWHDGFGTPRSHGCVNLSPLDARWLFAWTLPSVPVTWHGAMSAHGTLVSIHA